MKIPRSAVATVVEACMLMGARRAWIPLDAKTVVKCSRIRPMDRRMKSQSCVLTMGAPNYAERKYIKLCAKAGQPLPLRKPIMQWYKPKA